LSQEPGFGFAKGIGKITPVDGQPMPSVLNGQSNVLNLSSGKNAISVNPATFDILNIIVNDKFINGVN